MPLKVVVGAGATGIPTALLLARQVTMSGSFSRRGSGPDHPIIELVTADATDTEQLEEVPRGATTLFTAPCHRTTGGPICGRRWPDRCYP